MGGGGPQWFPGGPFMGPIGPIGPMGPGPGGPDTGGMGIDILTGGKGTPQGPGVEDPELPAGLPT